MGSERIGAKKFHLRKKYIPKNVTLDEVRKRNRSQKVVNDTEIGNMLRRGNVSSKPTPTPDPKPTPTPDPKPTPTPDPKPTPTPDPKPTPTPDPKPTPTPDPKAKQLNETVEKSGFWGKIGNFIKKNKKAFVISTIIGGVVGGALLLLNKCTKNQNTASVSRPEKPCTVKMRHDIKDEEVKNIAYKLQYGETLKNVIEAKYGIEDSVLNGKVREFIRTYNGIKKSGLDENGKTIIPKIEKDGKILYDAYYFPEHLPKDLGGAKYVDNEIEKIHSKKSDGVSQLAVPNKIKEKISDGYSVIQICKNKNGRSDSTVVDSKLSKADAEKLVSELNV